MSTDSGIEITNEITSASGETVQFYRRAPLAESPPRPFRGSDIRDTLMVMAARGIARRDVAARERLEAAAVTLRLAGTKPNRLGRFRERMTAALGPRPEDEERKIYLQFRRSSARRKIIAATALADRERPIRFDIDAGVEELRTALARGRGVLIWAYPFMAQTLMGKRGLWEHGFRPAQVSAEIHGFSVSRYSRKHLNPILVDAENWYLEDRLIIRPGSEAAVTRGVMRHLADGRPVILTNNIYGGSSFVTAPLGDRGTIRMSASVPGIALHHNVPLFAMTTLEAAPYRHYRISLASITRGGGSGTKRGRAARDRGAMGEAVLAVRDQLMKGLRVAPAQYNSWLDPSIDVVSADTPGAVAADRHPGS